MNDKTTFLIKPSPNGTVVKQTDAFGSAERTYYTFSWSTRNRTSSVGCPQWIDRIVIGDTPEGARKGKNLVIPDQTVASSSRSSRDVVAFHVDKDGKLKGLLGFTAALVPKVSGFGAVPIAEELWLTTGEFDASTGIAQIEGQCSAVAPMKPDRSKAELVAT